MSKSSSVIRIACVSILAASFAQQSQASQPAPQPAQTPAAVAPVAPASTCPAAPVAPIITGPLIQGAVLIQGKGNAYGDGCTSTIEVHSGGNVLPITAGSDPEVHRVDGAFSVTLQAALAAGQGISVTQIFLNTNPAAAAPAMPSVVSAAVGVVAPAAPAATASPAPTVDKKQLREGANAISGKAAPPSTTNGCTTQIEIHDVSDDDDDQLQLTTGLAANVNTDGTFSVVLQNALQEGQDIRIDEVFQGTCSAGVPPKLSSAVFPVVVPGDWGRVRGYFTSGILLSQDQNSFSQSSVFLGFILDKTWRMPGYYHQISHKVNAEKNIQKAQAKVDEVAAQSPADGSKHEKTLQDSRRKLAQAQSKAKAVKDKFQMSRWPGINTFFDVRLTSIPVSACDATNSSSSTSSPCTTPSPTPSPTPGATPTPSPTPGVPPTPSNASNNVDTFLSQRKTARLAVGVYFPWTITTWNYNKIPNALFIAPLAKVGFDTPAGSLSQVQPAATTGAAATSNTGTVTAVNPTSFYNFHGYGARIGHYALTRRNNAPDRSKAPDLVSYLDVIFGPFSNLETLIVPKGQQTPVTRTRLYRLALEGVLKVPSTPLIVGFNANVGQEAVLRGNHDIVQRAGDDLRFLFGVRFDAAKLMSAIAKAAP
jgi:hypothetical protein